ncbi:MAG: hypothetical protein AABX96_04170 [Nanoarchaeota archaeon]
MNLKKLKSENPELLTLEQNIEKLKSGKISKDLDKAVLLYIKRILEIAQLDDFDDDFDNRQELIEDIYLLQYEFIEEDGFTILSSDVMGLFFTLQGLKSLTKASYEVNKALDKY